MGTVGSCDSDRKKQVSSVASVPLPLSELIFVMFECHYVRSNKSVIVDNHVVK